MSAQGGFFYIEKIEVIEGAATSGHMPKRWPRTQTGTMLTAMGECSWCGLTKKRFSDPRVLELARTRFMPLCANER